MDPTACLNRADQAVSDCDAAEARAALQDYRNWRERGGFEPMHGPSGLRGDAFETQIRQRLESLEAQTKTCSLLSIYAWRDGSGWTWNNWHKVREVPAAWADLKPRALLKTLRAECGICAARGIWAVDDDGFNIVIMARGTLEPVWAIAYGEVL